MRGGERGPSEDQVRHALARLGADSASAPDVPAPVTARIVAALRSTPPAHATGADLPRLSRLRVILLFVGLAAAAVLAAVGIAFLHGAPAPRFPSGPTAEKITVSRAPADTPKAVVTRP